MAKAGQRKCMSCTEFFIPDHRKGERQRYCCAVDCRRVFNNYATLTSALLDRLLDHVETVVIEGKSYRGQSHAES